MIPLMILLVVLRKEDLEMRNAILAAFTAFSSLLWKHFRFKQNRYNKAKGTEYFNVRKDVLKQELVPNTY